MLDEITEAVLPIRIKSKTHDDPAFDSRDVQESFSQKYGNHPAIPRNIILELASLFKEMDGKYAKRSCEYTDTAFCHFLDFAIDSGGGLESIFDLTSADASLFFDYIQKTGSNKQTYAAFRSRLKQHLDIIFPKNPLNNNSVEGFSVAATAALREALIKEIDRIREKIPRLKNDLTQGKVLEIDPASIQCVTSNNVRLAVSGSINRADIIKTIVHYVPGFPNVSPKREEIATEEIRKNPGLLLLKRLKSKKRGPIGALLEPHFENYIDFVSYYYPTSYDAVCVLMYWGLVTGWNKQTIKSVGVDELNLRFKRNPYQDTLSKNHEIIRGKKSRGQHHTKSGFKPYTHLSDRSDPYGLFNVLKDFHELTKPLRKHDGPEYGPEEARNIFVFRKERPDRTGLIGYYGPTSPDTSLARFTSCNRHLDAPVEKFFLKHEIFDSPGVRIKKMTFEQLRTSYETVLEDMGLPLYVRQKLLGHSSMDTSIINYGSDDHATKLQMDKLGDILNELQETYRSAKFFQGALLTAENDPRRRTRENEKVIHFGYKDWEDNYIMLCENAKSPTWPGHQHYIKKGAKCSFLGRCLFCKRSLIGRETLPHLASWDQDIHDLFYEEGNWDSDLKFLELWGRSAIADTKISMLHFAL